MQRKFDILITATAKGISEVSRKTASEIQNTFGKGRLAAKAFNETVGNGHKVVAGMTGALKGMLAGVVGFQALRNVTNIMRDAENAAFAMQASVSAANREFDNVGSVSAWEQTVKNLSGELRIYSDTSLKNAISRTVDMTKRLGLSKDQMEEVIKRSADLGAGKVELEGAIERVTAALRGEAESAEYLGLTLNENYVKAWYESNKATEKAWKDLTDLEKAQVRYLLLLEQSDKMQGRAAASADTFGGALQEIRKEVTNAITNSKSLNDAMKEVAAVIKENAGEIGDLISFLVTMLAKIVQLAVEWRNFLVVLAGTAVAVKAISFLTKAVIGLNRACKILTGTSLLSWLGRGIIRLKGLTHAANLAGKSMRGFIVLAGVAGAIGIMKFVKAIYDWRKAAGEAQEAQDRLRENAGRLMERYKEFKDVELPGDLTRLAREDLGRLRQELAGARAYYTALKHELETRAEKKTLLGFATDDALAAQKELVEVNARLREIQADFEKVGAAATASAADMEKPVETVKATTEELEEFENQARKAYENASEEARKYAEEAVKWEEKIKYARLSTEDKLRELGRKGLTEEQAWADKRLQAEQKLAAAKEALKKKDFELAEKLAKDAEGLYADLAQEVKRTRDGEDVVVRTLDQTKRVAIAGVTEVGNFVQQLYGEQKSAAEKARDQWSETARGIEEQLNLIAKAREANVEIELHGLEAAQTAINELIRDETKHINVVVRRTEAKQAGGPIGLRAQTGRHLSGYGGGDRIRALLEAGEFVVRKEAVRKYGAALFHALNSMRLEVPDLIRARLGGMINNISIPAPRFAYQAGGPVAGVQDLGRVSLSVGGRDYPVFGERSVVEELKSAIEREKLMKGN